MTINIRYSGIFFANDGALLLMCGPLGPCGALLHMSGSFAPKWWELCSKGWLRKEGPFGLGKGVLENKGPSLGLIWLLLIYIVASLLLVCATLTTRSKLPR
jgi:hypothetical protein